LARFHRRRFSIPLGGIGGSNGKTTTKEMIGAILAAPYLLVRHLRASRAAHAPQRAAATQLVVGASL